MPCLFHTSDCPHAQRMLPLPPPFDPGDLNGRVSKGVQVLGPMRFSWITGKWTALANAYGTLAICEFSIYQAGGF